MLESIYNHVILLMACGNDANQRTMKLWDAKFSPALLMLEGGHMGTSGT